MMSLADWMAGTQVGAKISSCRENRRLVVVIVAIALFLDNMLLTTVGKTSTHSITGSRD